MELVEASPLQLNISFEERLTLMFTPSRLNQLQKKKQPTLDAMGYQYLFVNCREECFSHIIALPNCIPFHSLRPNYGEIIYHSNIWILVNEILWG